MSTFDIVGISILGAILGPVVLAFICYWAYKLLRLIVVKPIKRHRKYKALERRKLELDVMWLEENIHSR